MEKLLNIEVLDLEDKKLKHTSDGTKVGPNEIIYYELDQAIEKINKFVENIELNLQKNLEQQLNQFKKEINLDNYSEDDKICKFVEFIDLKEKEYLDNIKECLIDKTKIGKRELNKIVTNYEKEVNEIKKINKNSSLIKRIFNIKYGNLVKNEDIYKFKIEQLDKIYNKVSKLNDFIEDLPITKNNINFQDLKDSFIKYNKVYTLDSFVRENPLLKNKFSHLNIKPYNEKLKEYLNESKKDLIKIKEDYQKNTYEKIDLYKKRGSCNGLTTLGTSALNTFVLKGIFSIKDGIKEMKTDFNKGCIKIISGLIIVGVQAGVGDISKSVIENTSLKDFQSLKPAYTLVTGGLENLGSNSIDLLKNLQSNTVKLPNMDKIEASIRENIYKNNNHQNTITQNTKNQLSVDIS